MNGKNLENLNKVDNLQKLVISCVMRTSRPSFLRRPLVRSEAGVQVTQPSLMVTLKLANNNSTPPSLK